MSMALLKIENIRHNYGEQIVVNDLSLALETGEIGCLLGPSGCGKTTVLRCIAGFEPILSGAIHINGNEVSNAVFSVPPDKRRIGMVFQDYALFPHLDVTANINFGLHQLAKVERQLRIDELLQIVGLIDVANKFPHELSGGQQQRVALARALAPRPDLLLLDEPFSNLDISLRERLSLEVRDILKDQGITAIIVTHDQHEAFTLADQIGVMNEGEIQQWDAAYQLYHCPANRFIANFIGQGVFLPGKVLNSHQIEIELGVLNGNIHQDQVKMSDVNGQCSNVDVLLRPDDIVHDDASTLQAVVVHKAFRGADILYTLRLASGSMVLSLVPSHHNHAVGEKIGIRLEADHVVAFH